MGFVCMWLGCDPQSVSPFRRCLIALASLSWFSEAAAVDTGLQLSLSTQCRTFNDPAMPYLAVSHLKSCYKLYSSSFSQKDPCPPPAGSSPPHPTAASPHT